MTAGIPRRLYTPSASLRVRILVPHDPDQGCQRPLWLLTGRVRLADRNGRERRVGVRPWLEAACMWSACPAKAIVLAESVTDAIPKEAFQ